MSEANNPLGLVGIEFTEYATPDADYMDKVFTDFGFSKLKKLDKIQLQNINKTINDYVGYEVALKRKYYVC